MALTPAGPLLTMDRLATGVMVVVTLALLLAPFGSVTPAGAATLAVLVTLPDAGAVPVTVKVMLPPAGKVAMVALMLLPAAMLGHTAAPVAVQAPSATAS